MKSFYRLFCVFGLVISVPHWLGALEVGAPTELMVVQRDETDLGNIPVSLTLSENELKEFPQIKARAVLASNALRGKTTDWVSLVYDKKLSCYQGEVVAKAGGWYSLQLQWQPTDGEIKEVVVVEKVGVGDIFLTYGQSNSVSYGQDKSRASNPLVVSMDPKTRGWQICEDPQPTMGGAEGKGGSCWPTAGDYIAERTQCPVGFVASGWGGAWLVSLAPLSTSRLYENRLQKAIRFFPPNGFKAILFHQGESDSYGKTPTWRYVCMLKRLIQKSRKDAKWKVPWVIANISKSNSARIQYEDSILLAQQKVAAEDLLVFNGPYTDAMEQMDPIDAPQITSQYRGDNTHFNRRGAQIHGRWWGRILCEKLLDMSENRVSLTIDSSSIALNQPISFEIQTSTQTGEVNPNPVELIFEPSEGIVVKENSFVMTQMPRKEIPYLRIFAKARIPDEAIDSEESGNPLTGYAISEVSLLKIER